MTYFDTDWSPRFGFGGPRPITGLIGVCIHTTENDAGTPAENVANYQIQSESGSYHVLVDSRGHRLRENTDGWQTWSTANKGNDVLVHLSFVARAAWSRAQWLEQDRMLRAGATVVAHWCKTYGWPVRQVGVRNLPGITTHNATREWGGTDHTDPGRNFPWDVFLGYVTEAMNPPAPKPEKEAHMHPDVLNARLDRIEFHLRLILDQLVGPEKDENGNPRFTGWASTDGKTLTDLVGELDNKIDALATLKKKETAR
ncbi:N-acetylmuramoyl-L-alanine amidase [Corynebacterium pygosceleis]|uniref:N-acetylmuramoyl-L-alanine amidase n=1 Tax=Corynebacterium pygosceleis TaxID=2800406 RepID=UPI0020050641|nr:N-acetylmuramoyl-L-alanine amidase [Corynebacterium pygosceleis]MCK7676430.1 N-acetylmuramoyl-L-alanine amidase [Corynebacterium pygosceleis]